MNLRDRIAEAVGASPDTNKHVIADDCIAAFRTHLAHDIDATHATAIWISLRQAANETPIQFVRRIVGAYLIEATAE